MKHFMRGFIFAYLISMCIAQMLHWVRFRIPVFALFFIPPIIDFFRWMAEELFEFLCEFYSIGRLEVTNV